VHEDLQHYGVKGMKWGVRRYQNPDGTRIGSNPKLSRYGNRKRDEFLQKGYTPEHADRLALRKQRMRTIMLVAGGVTVAVGVMLVARQMNIQRRDLTLKADSHVFTIARANIQDLLPDKDLFVSVDKFDRDVYRRRLDVAEEGIKRVENTLRVNGDIKIPSVKQGESLYKEFVKSNPDLKNLNYKDFVRRGPYDERNVYPALTSKKIGEGWTRFKSFLIEKGYQGILDENDRVLSGFNTDRPAIIFKANEKLKTIATKTLKDSPALWERHVPTLKELTNTGSALAVGLVGGSFVVNHTSHTNNIAAYLKVYPDSNKTDKQIMKEMGDPAFNFEVYERYDKLIK